MQGTKYEERGVEEGDGGVRGVYFLHSMEGFRQTASAIRYHINEGKRVVFFLLLLSVSKGMIIVFVACC